MSKTKPVRLSPENGAATVALPDSKVVLFADKSEL